MKRVVGSYDKALRAIERGEYTREYAEELKTELSKVFNRGFWGGYYAGAKVVEHSTAYGSSATRRKEYVGKDNQLLQEYLGSRNYGGGFDARRGDEILIMGETTGVVEQHADGIMLDERPGGVGEAGRRLLVEDRASRPPRLTNSTRRWQDSPAEKKRP